LRPKQEYHSLQGRKIWNWQGTTAQDDPVPLCSIIIPVFNKAVLTRQCLEGIFRTCSGNHEIIVVDDASSDDTQTLLKEFGVRVRAVTHSTNKGFATSCNDGAAAATGENLIFLNNDTIPKAGWLDALVKYAGNHPRAAVLGAKLLFQNETVQHAGMAFRKDRHPIHIYAGFPANDAAVNKSRRFQAVTGACMFIRRSVFQETGGFDTAFLNSHEDVDLCLRIGKAGHEVHYCHESELYHLEQSTREANSPSEQRNTQLYLSRWRDYVQPDDFLYYVEDGLITAKYSMLYPIEISISPQLASHASWTEPHVADRILHERARQVYGLLVEKKRLALQQPGTEAATSKNEQIPGKCDPTPVPAGGHEETRRLLLQAHEQLLLRDEMHLETEQTAAAETIKRLARFLDQMDAAVERLYESGRWRWTNPLGTLRGLLGGRDSRPRGYGRIDDVLNSYKAWRRLHPILDTKQKS
jgi:GT2 family glycosyltransferase